MKKTFPLATTLPNASRIIYGCMGLGGNWNKQPLTQEDISQAHRVVETAIEAGISLFDHADIYTHGNAEQTFSHLFKHNAKLRENIQIQSKCSIRFKDQTDVGRYDASKAYIISAVEDSLKRLGTDYLDILLLHRPDPLMEPAEVAQAFDQLQVQGKVRHFGVSNMHKGQIALLQDVLDMPLVCNQLEMSLAQHDWIDCGTTFNDPQSKNIRWIGDTIEYCQLEGIQLQAWGALANGLFTGADLKKFSLNEKQLAAVERVRLLILQMSQTHQISKEAVIIAWLLRHPARIQPVIGTVNVDRIKACTEALKFEMSREEWYKLYVTARDEPLP